LCRAAGIRARNLKLNGELHHDYGPRLQRTEFEAVLIHSMSVSVDGFIADREGAFGWTAPSEELFHFRLVRASEGRLQPHAASTSPWRR
jgi:hypothetical protein